MMKFIYTDCDDCTNPYKMPKANCCLKFMFSKFPVVRSIYLNELFYFIIRQFHTNDINLFVM